MLNTTDVYPPYEGAIASDPDTGEAYPVTIPFIGVKSSQAAAIIAAAGKTLTLAANRLANPAYTALADFSSGGPRSYDSGLRPSVTAPGVSIMSAPVSYTHLDVYKRQRRDGAARGQRRGRRPGQES